MRESCCDFPFRPVEYGSRRRNVMIPFLRLPKVQFEFGAIEALPGELIELGVSRPLYLTDRGLIRSGVFSIVRRVTAGAEISLFDEIPENPTVEGIERALKVYRSGSCDGVVAVGGGSVIDSAKAVSLLAAHPGTVADYHSAPDKITLPVAPLIAVPTTAGTGSEVSRGAGIHPDGKTRSAGISSHNLVPKVAICDPNLTMSLPPELTASTGMDAFSHCVEGFLAKGVNPLVDAIALDGIRRTMTYLETAVADGRNREARWHMMMAALEGGISISKGLGPAHALGNTFGDRGFRHGILVTMALPGTLRAAEAHAADRLDVLAMVMGVKSRDALPNAIRDFSNKLGIPMSLSKLGYTNVDVDEAAEDASKSFFNVGSPHHPGPAEYKAIIQEMLT
jgi:4-hydroxybutyrate dehydrogenase